MFPVMHGMAMAVSWAYTNNLVSGVSDTSFAPNTPITREQAAVMLARYLKFSGVALESGTPDFQDTASISGYAKESVGAMQKAGLLSGDNEGNFRPMHRSLVRKSLPSSCVCARNTASNVLLL